VPAVPQPVQVKLVAPTVNVIVYVS